MRVEVFANNLNPSAVAVKLRRTDGARRSTSTPVTTKAHNSADRPRLAVVVVPAGQRPLLGLGPWLRTRFGIEQLQAVTVSRVEWEDLTSDRESPRAAERLRDRLALALLGRPVLVVVTGNPPLEAAWHAWPRSPADVARIVRRVHSWDLPVDVVGLWVNEGWTAGNSLVGSGELHSRPRAGLTAPRGGDRGDGCPRRLAESAWENEGGSVRRQRTPVAAAGTHGNKRSNRSKSGRVHFQARPAAARRGPSSLRSGLRPRAARLAAS